MSLPADFLWGFATAAYQIEGAFDQEGRAASIWDTFSKTPGKVADGKTGDVACNSYNLMDEDVTLLKSLGAQAYRFSISWSRVIPLGGRDDPVNEAGVQHYVTFVDKLLDAGIKPMVTLFHWDLPDALDKRYGGLLNKDEFKLDYKRYATVMFQALPKVKHWITFNEPWCSAVLGYNIGLHAPGRTSNREVSAEGDSSTECWIVGHSLLVAHGEAVKVYRDQFKAQSGGEIGITLNGDWAEPWDPEDPLDVEACDRKIEFAISWFADPVYFGHYPESMKKQLGDRLPEFTPEEVELIKGSNDFYGMNHYTANYIKHKTGEPEPNDFLGNLETGFYSKAGENIGPETQSVWLRPSPIGFRKLLGWLSKRYNYPKIYVTENGTSEAKMADGEKEPPFPEILEDEFRCEYFRGYINAMKDAVVEDGVNVRAYTAWSLMDNFEWAEGYVTRFGVTYVDYEGGQKRHPKKSARVIGELFRSLIKDA